MSAHPEEATLTEAEYHEAMHRVYRVCRKVTDGDPDRCLAMFRKQVDKLRLSNPPPLPERFQDAA